MVLSNWEINFIFSSCFLFSSKLAESFNPTLFAFNLFKDYLFDCDSLLSYLMIFTSPFFVLIIIRFMLLLPFIDCPRLLFLPELVFGLPDVLNDVGLEFNPET